MILFLNFCFTVRGSRPGKNVQLSENEIRGLCLKSREIFLSQPILLELEAPLKICGKIKIYSIPLYETFLLNYIDSAPCALFYMLSYVFQVTSTVNTMILLRSCERLSLARLIRNLSSWATTLTEAKINLRSLLSYSA